MYCLWLGLLVCQEGQAQAVRRVMTLPLETPFDQTYWRFRAGNNPTWAQPTYSDDQWATISPATPLHHNQVLWQTRQGWFRLPFQLHRNQVSQPLQLVVKQFGNSIWYLDGKRLATLNSSTLANQISQQSTQFIALRLPDTNRHVLAVYYRFQPQSIYYAGTTLPAFEVQADWANQVGQYLIDRNRGIAGLSFGLASLFLLLGVMHLLVYRATLGQQINQWLAATQLSIGIFFLLEQLNEFGLTLPSYSLVNMISVLAGHVAYGLLLTTVYRYVRQPTGWIYWLLIGLLLASFVYRVGVDVVSEEWDLGLLLLLLLDYIRVSWLGKRQPDRDDSLPWHSLRVAFYALLGLAICGLLVGISTALHWYPSRNLMMVLLLALMTVMLLSVPVGLSLTLVREYARTYLSLRLNIQQVEQLSAQTLAQEQEKKALLTSQNQRLEEQVQRRTAELHHSLEELRQVQDQLIQREKLASLGELTAGVAHEIQNPLNFVNNFSEVSVELIDELQQGPIRSLDGAEREYAYEILGDLTQNLQKVLHHGNRAGNIVKSMLEHSRPSSGRKEWVDLNALINEQLQLTYQGLNARNKPFTINLLTDFEADVGVTEVMPQELSRVLVNLFANAFYAVQQKQSASPGYQPQVKVSTQRSPSHIRIQIQDNGTGISRSDVLKVFQPFFTTKPTGEGTGLGLWISYDIITKGHQGSLLVVSEPGVGSEFTIQLPVIPLPV